MLPKINLTTSRGRHRGRLRVTARGPSYILSCPMHTCSLLYLSVAEPAKVGEADGGRKSISDIGKVRSTNSGVPRSRTSRTPEAPAFALKTSILVRSRVMGRVGAPPAMGVALSTAEQ